MFFTGILTKARRLFKRASNWIGRTIGTVADFISPYWEGFSEVAKDVLTGAMFSYIYYHYIRRPLYPAYYWIISKFGFVVINRSFQYADPEELAQEIKSNPRATKIWIENSGGMEELNLEGMPKLPYVKVLVIRYSDMNGTALAMILKNADNLEYITLDDGCKNINDCDLTDLQPLKSLKYLHVQRFPAHLLAAIIKAAPNLQQVEALDGCDFSAIKLDGLGPRPKLIRVGVFGTKFNQDASSILREQAPQLLNDELTMMSFSNVGNDQVMAKFPKILHSVYRLFNSIYSSNDMAEKLMTISDPALIYSLLQELNNDNRSYVLSNVNLIKHLVINRKTGININPLSITREDTWFPEALKRLSGLSATSSSKANSLIADTQTLIFSYLGDVGVSQFLTDHHAYDAKIRRDTNSARLKR